MYEVADGGGKKIFLLKYSEVIRICVYVGNSYCFVAIKVACTCRNIMLALQLSILLVRSRIECAIVLNVTVIMLYDGKLWSAASQLLPSIRQLKPQSIHNFIRALGGA